MNPDKPQANSTSLKDPDQFSSQLLESLPFAIYTCDVKGNLKFYNLAALQLWGIEPNIGVTTWCGSWKIYKPDGSPIAHDKCPLAVAILEERAVEVKEIVIERPDGVRIHVLSHPMLIRDSMKNIVGGFNILEEITELRIAERRLMEISSTCNEDVPFFKNELKQTKYALEQAKKALAFRDSEKEKRAAELAIANGELAFQNNEKNNRATELELANIELVFQNEEKGKRAAELIVANEELAFQNSEKEKRAAELILANGELAFQIGEREKRSAELVIANLELAFQNEEKGKRESELVIANNELAFQNAEKEKRAAELVVANNELAFQNEEKEKRAAELILVNSELEAFSYVSSHDLQEPLRKIQNLSSRLLETDNDNLSDKGKGYVKRMQAASSRMRLLIDDLLAFSRLSVAERIFKETDLNEIIDEVKNEMKEVMEEKHVTIEAGCLCKIKIIPFQFRQIMYNLINNALKFSRPGVPPHIVIKSTIAKGMELEEAKLTADKKYCHISISDNGIGFEPQYRDRIFEVFQRLHGSDKYSGSGIGLAIVKKVIDNHHGTISATGVMDEGATFNMYIPLA